MKGQVSSVIILLNQYRKISFSFQLFYINNAFVYVLQQKKIEDKVEQGTPHETPLGQIKTFEGQNLLQVFYETLKREVSSYAPRFCSCINVPESYVRQRFHHAFQRCSTIQKLNFFHWMLQTAKAPSQQENILDINQNINISVQSFLSWKHQQSSKIVGYRLVTDTEELDLRRYLVRASKAAHNTFVLESIYEIEPQTLRISFDQNSEKEIEIFLKVARRGFLYEAEVWSKNSEHISIKPNVSVVKKQKKIDFQNDEVQKDIWFQIIKNLGRKESQNTSQQKMKKFVFTEQSEEEQKDLRNALKKIKSQKQKKITIDRKKNSLMTTNATFENESKSDKFRKRKTSIGVLAFEPMKRNEKNVIKQILPGYNIRDIDNMTEFVTITKKDHISEKVTAYNHQTENEIKAKIKFKKISPKLVVLGLLDFMSYKKWNKLIESSQLRMKLQSQNSMISEIKVKDIPKPLVVLTHLCEYQNQYIIIMKCLESKKKHFSFIVIRIHVFKGHTNIIYHIKYPQKSDFALKFLKQVDELDNFLQSNSSRLQLKQYLKFGRLIDKDMNNILEEHERRSHQYSYASQEFGNVQQITQKQSKQELSFNYHSIDSFSQFPQKNK